MGFEKKSSKNISFFKIKPFISNYNPVNEFFFQTEWDDSHFNSNGFNTMAKNGWVDEHNGNTNFFFTGITFAFEATQHKEQAGKFDSKALLRAVNKR